MQDGIHSHGYEGIMIFAAHSHPYSGETSQEPYYNGHHHYLSGYTAIFHGHTHHYSIITGPDIQSAAGHIHYYMGHTNVEQRHNHYIWGYTHINGRNSEPKKYFTLEEAKKIGDQLGIDWSRFDPEQYRIGLNVELEHGKIDPHTNVSNDDPIITGKIALAHLNEFPDYYLRLTKMEAEAEEYHHKS